MCSPVTSGKISLCVVQHTQRMSVDAGWYITYTCRLNVIRGKVLSGVHAMCTCSTSLRSTFGVSDSSSSESASPEIQASLHHVSSMFV